MELITVSGTDIGVIEISNLKGQLIKQTTQSTLDLSQLADGVYVLVVRDNEGLEVNRTKVIKQ